MAYVAHQACPNQKCSEITPVYVDTDEIPAMEDAFAYQCPKCKKKIVARFGAYSVEDSIPNGATVAQPVQ